MTSVLHKRYPWRLDYLLLRNLLKGWETLERFVGHKVGTRWCCWFSRGIPPTLGLISCLPDGSSCRPSGNCVPGIHWTYLANINQNPTHDFYGNDMKQAIRCPDKSIILRKVRVYCENKIIVKIKNLSNRKRSYVLEIPHLPRLGVFESWFTTIHNTNVIGSFLYPQPRYHRS